MTRAEQLREQALALYAEARAIYRSGWDPETMRRYREKYMQAHAIDMAHVDAKMIELRQERERGD